MLTTTDERYVINEVNDKYHKKTSGDMSCAEICIFFLCLTLFTEINALRFLVRPGRPVCVKEEAAKGVVVTGDYSFTEGTAQLSNIVVTDFQNHILFKRQDFTDLTGKFAFTTDKSDLFEICVSTKSQHSGAQAGMLREVELNIRHGLEAKDYEQIAKAEHLLPVEMELRRLEDLGESLLQDFAAVNLYEEDIRSTNESTNSRVLYLTLFSVGCLLLLASWQVLYLRRFFRAKKLID
ncbi:Transmembrane emp24 domain-containing protein 10 [Trichinella pseudospiralis]|uniref:Transmembrane emp24 domain-containing protein 10 n=1 Tax=Trichinella pseudospiralis TaxID=6337 RepID=A0A0V1HL16_TRIPS|nr:Transmembrane emp24 domain-containing protein 10 [Trichinella pseudospiralis]